MTTDRLITQLQQLPQPTLRELFAADESRFTAFSRRLDDLLIDFSKTHISPQALQLLLQLAQAANVKQQRDAMFAGEKINRSENRGALHTALRTPTLAGAQQQEVEKNRSDMLTFAEQCRSGAITAADGKPYTDVINIGIGGSSLGPELAVAALAPYQRRGAGALRLHFVANMDGAPLADTLADLDAARTLVIVSSKTFTTTETLLNAAAARQWLTAALGETAAAQQIVAVTAAPQRAAAEAVARVFSYHDWVGGRYSLWGAAGLPIALAVGAEHFKDFLRGAAAMDTHFQNAPAEDNLPLLLALVGVWHRTVCGYPTRVILPYDERLALLPGYLQQLDMESNGKHLQSDGTAVTQATAPVVWGSPGTTAQHAYFQLLHQGTDIVPSEFIAAVRPTAADNEQHRLLLANCLAQSAALMNGAETGETGGRQFPGNRPSVTILYDQLTPYALGRLLALYEHRTFSEGVLWGVNAFDQPGVELGKQMARQLRPLLDDNANDSEQDASTRGLLAYCRMTGRTE